MPTLSKQVEAVELENSRLRRELYCLQDSVRTAEVEFTRKLRQVAPGNAIFFFRNGTSRPMTIPPSRDPYFNISGCPYEHCLPPHLESFEHAKPFSPSCYTTITFRNTYKRDAVGRVIFEEV